MEDGGYVIDGGSEEKDKKVEDFSLSDKEKDDANR